jgi:transcriptional regulator with XRE-family HTH domain
MAVDHCGRHNDHALSSVAIDPDNTLQPHLSGRHLLGARLRSLRQSWNLSQAQLGELVFCSGHLIGKIEKAERRAQPDLIRRCDDVLGAEGRLVELLGSADTELLLAKRAHYERMYRHVGGVPVAPSAEAFLRHLLEACESRNYW